MLCGLGRGSRVTVLGAIVAAVVVAVAGVGAQASLLSASAPSGEASGCLPGQKCAIQFRPPCSDSSTLPLGVIAVVRHGVPTPATVDGHEVEPLLLDAGRTAPVPGSERLVFIDDSARQGDAPAQVVYAIHNDARFQNAGTVATKAREPALCTWDNQLSDKPAAAALIAPVTAAIVRAHIASTATIEAAGTTWDVTDDPLDSSQLIVVVYVAGAPEPPRAANAPTVFGLRAIVAFVDRATHDVTMAGFAPAWDSPLTS